MPFCATCGTNVEGRFCAKCGTPAPGEAAAQPGPGYSAPPSGAQPYSAGASSSGLADNMASALCYLFGFITGILFLAIAPYNQSRTVRFHAWQAIFFNVSIIVLWMVMIMLMFITPFFLDMILSGIWMLMGFGVFFLWLFLMFKAYSNDRLKLPIIGDLAEKQAG